jgi:hypothetical protein
MTPPRSGFLSPSFIQRHEQAIVIFVLALFLGFNVVTAPFSPDPWLDEVSYSEPAANLAAHGTLSSDAWEDRGRPVWTGNVPLHQLLLAGFIKVFGFNCRTVRGVNMLYYSITVFLIYQIVRRHDLIRKTRFRLLLVAVLLAGTGLVALYRNGRYDAIGALLVIFWIWCSLQSRKRPVLHIGSFLSAMLMPVASLNIAPLLALCALLALCLWRWKALSGLAVAGFGGLVGMGLMQLVYSHFGVPHIFHAVMGSAGGRDLAADFIQSVFKNPSYIAGIAGGCLLVFSVKGINSSEDPYRKRIAMALLALAVILPWFMALVAKYHIYYTWMAIIPASICACMVIEFQSVPGFLRKSAIVLILLAALPGFPRRCVRIAGSWAQHRPSAIAGFALKEVSRSDVVYADVQCAPVYYALHSWVARSFWLAPPVGADDKALITVAFMPEPGREKEVHDLLGGEWRQTDFQEFGREKLQLLSESPVRIAVYRRH